MSSLIAEGGTLRDAAMKDDGEGKVIEGDLYL